MNPYDDIIHLPRPVSRTRLPMPLAARAAQFAPFAALTGHDEAIARTARRIMDAYEHQDTSDSPDKPDSTFDDDSVF